MYRAPLDVKTSELGERESACCIVGAVRALDDWLPDFAKLLGSDEVHDATGECISILVIMHSVLQFERGDLHIIVRFTTIVYFNSNL
jgi:hypothetical protein